MKVLKQAPLFNGICENDIVFMLNCLSAKTESFSKGKFIFHAGDSVSSVGMVLSGRIHVIKEDFWGNRSILSEITAGQLFGETYACIQKNSDVSVFTAEKVELVFLDIRRITTTCQPTCAFHNKLIQNLMQEIAEKNWTLTNKIEHVSKRTTRDKLLSYLSAQAQKQKSSRIEIPFNRQQLADYLSVDRSAMSNELCKMRDEGILEFYKNSFTLHEI